MHGEPSDKARSLGLQAGEWQVFCPNCEFKAENGTDTMDATPCLALLRDARYEDWTISEIEGPDCRQFVAHPYMTDAHRFACENPSLVKDARILATAEALEVN